MTLLNFRFQHKYFLIYFVLILFLFFGCAELDGIIPKIRHQNDFETKKSLPDSESVTKKQLQISEENSQLLKKIEQLEQELNIIKKLQKDQSDNFLLLQEQWEMNFILLERSVEESLRSSKVSESAASMITQVLKNQPLNHSTGSSNIVKQGSIKPIENYSLLKNSKTKLLQPDLTDPPTQLAEINNLDLNSEKTDIEEEPGFAKNEEVNLNDLEDPLEMTNTLDMPDPEIRAIKSPESSRNDHSINLSKKSMRNDFSDPDLVPPADPFILIRHPGVKKIYNQGMTAVIQKDHKQAILVFESFTSRFPDNLDSDNAFYWIGRSYFEINELKKAEEAFRKVLTRYEHLPTSQGYKTADSIYMLGKLRQEQNLEHLAIYYFEEVTKRFPGSAAARNAERDLVK